MYLHTYLYNVKIVYLYLSMNSYAYKWFCFTKRELKF